MYLFRSKQVSAALLVACLLICVNDSQAGKPGGGSTAGNNVTVAYDTNSDTVTVTGDGAGNVIYVEVWDDQVFVGQDGGYYTTINGLAQDLQFDITTAELNLVIDLRSGNDRVRFHSAQSYIPCHVSIAGGDGADELIASHTLDSATLNGDILMDGGRGDDVIQVRGLQVAGDLMVSGGDNNDTVAIVDTSWNGGFAPLVSGASLLDGGRGNDSLTAPAYFLSGSLVRGFETATAE